MIKATIAGQAPFEISFPTAGGGDNALAVSVGDEQLSWDAKPLPGGGFSIILNNKSYLAQVLKVDRAAKIATVAVNGSHFEVAIEEPMDRLLTAMGIKNASANKVNDIKAPMPGLVLQVLVSPGQAIKKGDPVLVLEAMKMENVFKASTDAVVKEVKVSPKKAVEKGEVLVVLE